MAEPGWDGWVRERESPLRMRLSSLVHLPVPARGFAAPKTAFARRPSVELPGFLIFFVFFVFFVVKTVGERQAA